MSFYRMTGTASRASPRTPCAHCSRPLREHKHVATDRDGPLHECPPRPPGVQKPRPVRLRIPQGDGAGPFGADVAPEDSARLAELREIIDTEIGWASEEDEEAGDYAARLREVAALLKRRPR